MPGGFLIQIAAFLSSHPGAVCCECIATALALPLRQVTIATMGFKNRDGFLIEPDMACTNCGMRGRVIRAVPSRPTLAGDV